MDAAAQPSKPISYATSYFGIGIRIYVFKSFLVHLLWNGLCIQALLNMFLRQVADKYAVGVGGGRKEKLCPDFAKLHLWL